MININVSVTNLAEFVSRNIINFYEGGPVAFVNDVKRK